MRRKVVLMRIEASQLPQHPGDAADLEIEGQLLQRLEGWAIVSHTVSQQLTGEMLLSVMCERPEGL